MSRIGERAIILTANESSFCALLEELDERIAEADEQFTAAARKAVFKSDMAVSAQVCFGRLQMLQDLRRDFANMVKPANRGG